MNKKTFFILLFLITALGFFLRFWNYSERFGLAYDQAHDVLVAREAIRQGKIPLLGPFSSAGPFQTSGTWYWLLMLPTFIYPQSILSPWIFLTVCSVALIIGMGLFGKWIEDEWFGLLIAFLTAVSTAQIAQSVNLTNQTPIPIFAFLAIACAMVYLRKKDIFSAFGLGLFSSLAASIHLQGVALAFLVLWTFLLAGRRQKVTAFITAIIGAVLPFLPIFIWDTRNGFVNTKNMWYYYRIDQFNISLDVLGRRWLTYLSDFWPREWAHVIGGNPVIAVGIAVLAVLLFVGFLAKKKLKKEWLLLFLSFFCMVVLVRYMRVPIFASFITFAHPFVLLISAWVIHQAFKFNRVIGIVFLLIILTGSLWKTQREVFTPVVNWTAKNSEEIIKVLESKYPGERFSVYDLNYGETRRSVPLVLYLDEKNLLSDSGRRIGFISANAEEIFIDLSSSDSARLKEDKWIQVNPSFIYRSTEEWRHSYQ